MKTNKSQRQQILYLVQLALLLSILTLLNFTPLGFPKIGPVHMTLMSIPVIVGAIVLGPAAGTFLGLTFGIFSFMLAPSDPLFSVVFASKPFTLAVICIIPRMLIGITSSYAAKIFKKSFRSEKTSYVLASLIGSLTNTVLFIGGVILLLNQLLAEKIAEFSEKSFTIFWLSIAAINGIPEAIVCTIVSASVIVALKKLNTNLK